MAPILCGCLGDGGLPIGHTWAFLTVELMQAGWDLSRGSVARVEASDASLVSKRDLVHSRSLFWYRFCKMTRSLGSPWARFAWTPLVAMGWGVAVNRFGAGRPAFITSPANKTWLLDEMRVGIESVFMGWTYRGPSA